MYRGTTPSLVFKFPFNISEFNALYVTFDQQLGRKLERTLNDTIVEDNTLIVNLSQEETLSFISDRPVKVQIRAKKPDGTAMASNIITLDVKKILKGGKI